MSDKDSYYPNWRKPYVTAAKQLGYSKEVQAAIMNAKTHAEVSRIMTSARNAAIAAAEKEDAIR